MKIAFQTPCITVRGTENAVFYYALYNETLLGNESIIITPTSGIADSDTIAISKFKKRFRLIYYSTLEEMEDVINDCDILYCIKYGKYDGVLSTKIKTVIHCVFDMTEPHGQVYAGVSEALACKFGQKLFVPHMIGLKPSYSGENLREQLCIPRDAVVFGRMGGYDTFDLEIGRNAIKRVLKDFDNIYFVFINTPSFVRDSKAFFLDKIIDEDDKNRFIVTCDAHMECGTLGHSFGISLGEASVNNKPCICYNGDMWNTSHLQILGDKGLYFNTEEQLYNILSTFNPLEHRDKDYNCYRKYSPEKVMEQFKQVFIDEET
jgi:hypothetical protein